VTSTPPSGFDAPAEPAPAPAPAAPQLEPGSPTVARAAGRPGWRPWTAWGAILAGFGLTVFGGMIVAIVTAAMGASVSDPSPGVNIGLTLFQNLALLSAALLFARLSGVPSAADFGLRRPALGRAFGLLLGVWLLFYAISAAWVSALGLDEKQTLPDELGVTNSTLNLALVMVLITVVAPLGEELFFRGYFFAALRNWKGWVPAAIITGLIFGAIHIGSAPIGLTVPLAFFGFGLCVLYHKTGSLYPCIALHAMNNAVALGLTQKWTWEIAPLLVGAVIASLTVAWLLARGLGARGAASAVAPAL
jgi:membrane protease YdiL (CAAX protease family)